MDKDTRVALSELNGNMVAMIEEVKNLQKAVIYGAILAGGGPNQYNTYDAAELAELKHQQMIKKEPF